MMVAMKPSDMLKALEMAGREGGVTPVQLAAALGIDRSQAWRILHALEAEEALESECKAAGVGRPPRVYRRRSCTS